MICTYEYDIYFDFDNYVATRLSFKQPAYSVHESKKEVELQLVLSKSRSTNLTVQVIDFDITATSKLNIRSTYIEKVKKRRTKNNV